MVVGAIAVVVAIHWVVVAVSCGRVAQVHGTHVVVLAHDGGVGNSGLGTALVYGASITIVDLGILVGTLAGFRIACVVGTSVLVVALHGLVGALAGLHVAHVGGADIRVIAVLGLVLTNAQLLVAEIGGAGVFICTVLVNVDTAFDLVVQAGLVAHGLGVDAALRAYVVFRLALCQAGVQVGCASIQARLVFGIFLDAPVVGAGVEVLALFGNVDRLAGGRVAGIDGTGVAVVREDDLVLAVAGFRVARIHGADVAVVAVLRTDVAGERAVLLVQAWVAVVHGAKVTIIASGQVLAATGLGQTGIRGAVVVVVAVHL